jgi:hypothetical protein
MIASSTPTAAASNIAWIFVFDDRVGGVEFMA